VTGPPIERYVRSSITCPDGDTQVIIGLEVRDGETWVQMKALARSLVETGLGAPDPFVAAGRVQWAILSTCPDRYWFVEVGNDDDWVQVYRPHSPGTQRPCS